MDSVGKTNVCKNCGKTFQLKTSLNRHLKNVHHEASNQRSNIKCPAAACAEVFPSRSDLRNHIEVVHKEKLEMQEMEFSSFKEFQVWKESIEKEMKCSYVRKHSQRTLASGSKVYYYSCFRSGSHVSSSARKRRMKSLGTRKIGGFCPSSMDVSITSDGKTTTKFWPTHFGHDVNIGHMFLSSAEKLEIAGKLRQGVSFDRILDDVRDNAGGDVQRIHLLNRKDLHNIARDFRILNFVKLQSDDATSVKLWVQSMKEAGENSPVIFFKEQDEEDPVSGLKKEDFELVIMTEFQQKMLWKFGQDKICIDSTDATNAHDFQLTTLMVMDECGAGCPVAFCLSNRVDEEAMQVFFEAVKQKAGKMSCAVFMSDDAAAFYNAWRVVMGPSTHQLLCTWHVDRLWRKNLNKIRSGNGKKAMVYKTIRNLMQERDQDNFYYLISNFEEQILEDEDTKPFGEYFITHYATRPEVWALCFRPLLGINTNVHLESMHKTLKHYYLEGRKNKRIDKTVNMLMRLSRDKIFERQINLSKKIPSGKIKKIIENHIQGLNINPGSIEQVNENEWVVPSESSEKLYTVQKVPSVENCDCNLKCSECKICIHMFECTCMDNFIQFNICKHIHACMQTVIDNGVQVNEEIESIVATSSIARKQRRDMPNKLDELKEKISLLFNLTDHLEEEKCDELTSLTDKALSLLMQKKASSFDDKNKKGRLKKRKS